MTLVEARGKQPSWKGPHYVTGWMVRNKPPKSVIQAESIAVNVFLVGQTIWDSAHNFSL